MTHSELYKLVEAILTRAIGEHATPFIETAFLPRAIMEIPYHIFVGTITLSETEENHIRHQLIHLKESGIFDLEGL